MSQQTVCPDTDSFSDALQQLHVATWFDLGLVLDGIRDRRGWPQVAGQPAADYAKAALAGCGSLGPIRDMPAGTVALDDAIGEWGDFQTMFATRLERGGDVYNALIGRLWAETCATALELSRRMDAAGVRALLVSDYWSRPDHVPAAIALLLLSELRQIPVLAEHRDACWNRRDAYATNAHLGEVYACVEACFPWDSPWAAHRVADEHERDILVRDCGINPAWISVAGDWASLIEMPAGFACGINAHAPVIAALGVNAQRRGTDQNLARVAAIANRRYLPGLTPLEYMISLASLIDPNAFRVEEKTRRGRVFGFALARIAEAGVAAGSEMAHEFLQQCEYLFEWHDGEDTLVVDHSLSYRHRHLRHYPYRKLTENELCGVVGLLAEGALPEPVAQHPADSSATSTLVLPVDLRIDHRSRLQAALASGRPVVWLPDSEAGCGPIPELESLLEQLSVSTQVTVLARPGWGGGSVTAAQLAAVLASVPGWAERLADGRCRIVETGGVAAGTHLAQLGEPAVAALEAAGAAGGCVVSFGHANTLSLDCLSLPSFRLGTCADALQASFMGLAPGESYCLWVPAGLRPSLAYPTPIQTPLEFSTALQSPAFAKACAQHGEAAVLAALSEDADRYGTPAAEVLAGLSGSDRRSTVPGLESHLFTGLHANGEPWSGAYARLQLDAGWHFETAFAESRHDTVLDLISQFRERGGDTVPLAWNGGYILNAELVGKLALPERYIGTPLGLLIERGRVRSLPLLNKPALGFDESGDVVIRPANLFQGLGISVAGHASLELPAEARNQPSPKAAAYFDLFHEDEALDLQGRTAYRFAGGRIISVHRDLKSLPLLPVGLTVTVPSAQEPAGWAADCEVEYRLPGWEGISGAIEAGPMLVRAGAESIEMEAGGWKTAASIRTQAARLDYTHMRGPKIAVGLTPNRELLVVAVNGRIRESVGATHAEIGKILLDMGAETAMGFDPGGSVTLVVHGRQLNISPYNGDYMRSPLSLPPQPRFVGNAVLAMPRRPESD